MITCGCNLFEWGTFLRRIDNFLMDTYADEENVELLVEQLMIRHMATLKKVCESVGDIVDILRFGDDLGWILECSCPGRNIRLYLSLIIQS